LCRRKPFLVRARLSSVGVGCASAVAAVVDKGPWERVAVFAYSGLAGVGRALNGLRHQQVDRQLMRALAWTGARGRTNDCHNSTRGD
jgi:hypothetical protein